MEIEMSEILPPAECAVNYLRKGFSVVPVARGEKRPLIAWAVFQKRRASEAEARGWFEKWPDAGVGIVCGQVSGGLAVLDIDPRNGGVASIKGKPLPPTPCVKTGGGGWHYYFRGANIPKKTGLLLGVDLQAEGSFVVAPPSLHPSGEIYEWTGGLGLGQIEIAALPPWVHDKIAGQLPRPGGAIGQGLRSENILNGVPEGKRHDALVRETGRLLGKGLGREEVRVMIDALNQKNRSPLPQAEVDGIIESLAKKQAAKPQQGGCRYTAAFDGLVELVELRGKAVFLVKGPDGGPNLVEERRDEAGQSWRPPEKENLPWLLPRAEEVLKRHEEATAAGYGAADQRLFDDLAAHHESVSELPGPEYYRLLAAFDLHTYLLEPCQYSPILAFYAVPERGKTRTGKGLIYVVRRGIHVESLRDSYLIRAAHDLGASILFDVRDLWGKAEKMGSEDILLHRFERGGKVPRVNCPEKGAFRDTTYYSVFGPTIISTNKPLHQILDTRCIPIQMRESAKRFERDVTPEAALPLKERLTAFRLRHLGEALPEADKPARGRLGDITRPILQIIRLASPRDEAGFLKLIRALEEGRKIEKSDSWEAQVIAAVEAAAGEHLANGLVAAKDILDEFNQGKTEREQWTPHRIGKTLAGLGFKKGKTSNGSSGVLYDEGFLKRLKTSYGLEQTSVTPVSPASSGGDPGFPGLTEDTLRVEER
ncbi:MAG TPA: bifunctional DNA primase/polymerase [Elusimicrobiota bacterium]|nr:bifunctional DNA primase/polymerase [Elusimicrobiota bacterium]